VAEGYTVALINMTWHNSPVIILARQCFTKLPDASAKSIIDSTPSSWTLHISAAAASTFHNYYSNASHCSHFQHPVDAAPHPAEDIGRATTALHLEFRV
jgi:hypothetical protein